MRNPSFGELFGEYGTQAKARVGTNGSIARGLRRRHTPSPMRNRSDRWSQWSRNLAGRHRFLAGFWTSCVMDLVEPHTGSTIVNRVIRQHWIASLNFFPRVQLATQQILRTLPGFSERVVVQTRNGEPANPPSLAASAGIRSHKGLASSEYAMADPRANRPAIQGEDRDDEVTTGHRNQRSPAPLLRAFKRLQSEEELSFARSGIARIQQAVASTMMRIVESTRRVEERNARPPATSPGFVYKQNTPSPRSPNTNLDDFPEAASPIAAGPPRIDVDELTSTVIREIDKRATAWRERMGRV